MASETFGVVRIAQVEPFQRSDKGFFVPEESSYVPTATQYADDTHDTADTWLDLAPAGSGTVTVTQLAPVQRTPMPCSAPPPSVELPTAAQKVDAEQLTAARLLVLAPDTVGMVCVLHEVPSHFTAEI